MESFLKTKREVEMPLGFKARKRKGNWKITDERGKSFTGEFKDVIVPVKVESFLRHFRQHA